MFPREEMEDASSKMVYIYISRNILLKRDFQLEKNKLRC